MDNDPQVQVIESRLTALDAMPVTDDPSARAAYSHVMATVSRINRISSQAHAQAMMGVGGPIDDLLGRLAAWLDRLVSALTQIVEKLAKAVSFSVSVGTTVSVSVEFAPFAGGAG
jgi:hypothetical protein